MKYQLLATDMDGTLLDDRKKISEKNRVAINKALDQGKDIVFCTGRCLSELKEFFADFPKMRYVLMESGACIYDLQERKILYQKCLDPSAVEKILRYVHEKDVMIQVLADGKSYLPDWALEKLDKFGMPQYYDHFTRTATFVKDTFEECMRSGWHAEKICIYHTGVEERQRTREYIEKQELDVTLAFSELTSLEISPEGVDKGVALKRICDICGIGMNQAIAMGDGMNDEAVLKIAGLPIAVANADPKIREICKYIVATNEDSGVAEAIGKFML